MANTFRCSIVTPVSDLFDGEVTYASVPAWDGQLGVMVGQSPVLSRLDAGVMRLDPAGGESRWFFVDGGFVQVHENVLTVLTENAAASDALSLEDAEAELAEANARVARSGEDYARVSADQRRAMAKIAAIKRIS